MKLTTIACFFSLLALGCEAQHGSPIAGTDITTTETEEFVTFQLKGTLGGDELLAAAQQWETDNPDKEIVSELTICEKGSTIIIRLRLKE